MRATVIVGLAPAIQTLLCVFITGEAAALQKLDLHGAVHAFDFAHRLRVFGAAMQRLDAELQEPVGELGEVAHFVDVAPRRSIVGDYGAGQSIAFEHWYELIPYRHLTLIRA